MRSLLLLLALVLPLSLSGQKWERLDRKFSHHYEEKEYMQAAETATKEVDYSARHFDSTDLRYMLSYYHLALAHHGLKIWEPAISCLATAYNLMVPYYALHGAAFADVCDLYGRVETELGFHETASNFLTYARDVRVAVFGKESYQYITSLYHIVDLEMARAGWDQVIAVLEEALAIHESYFPVNQDYARYANFLGLIYMNNGMNREAEAAFERALSVYNGEDAGIDMTFAHASNNLALVCYYLSDFERSALHFERADSIYRLLTEGYSGNYLMLLNNLASLYYSWGKPDLAREAYLKLEAYLDRYPDPADLVHLQAIENAANYHSLEGELGMAERYFKQAIALRRSAFPDDRRELARGILLLASLYADGERPGLAAGEAVEAYRILEEECPPGDPDLVLACSFLGYNYLRSGQPNRAIYFYEIAREQIELSEGPVSPEAAAVYNNLGTLYYDQGRMKEAIPCFERSLELQPEDPVTLSNLGFALLVMEDPVAARERFDQARMIYEQRYGKDHPDYARALIQGFFPRAAAEEVTEKMLQEIQQAERILADNKVDSTGTVFIDCIKAYRLYYFEKGDFRRALAFGERTLRLVEQGHGRNSELYALTLLEQAGSLTRLRDRERLERIYREASRIASGLEQQEMEDLLYEIESSRYSNYYYLGEYDLALRSMERAIETDKARFLANQGNLSVQERARYARSLTRLVDYNDFLMHFPDDPQVLSRALDNRLFIKSLLMDSERRVKKTLETSTDQELQGMHAEYDATERKLSNLRSQFGVDKRILDSLQDAVMLLEREISRRLGEELESAGGSPRWQEIRDALGEDEAAVEVVMFYHTMVDAGVSFRPLYLAFVITRDMEEHPVCIQLFDALEAIPYYERYRASVEGALDDPPGPDIYECLWSKIDKAVEGKKTIFFSPDGIFHEMNVEALTGPDGRQVIDKYEIRTLYTLADLLEGKGDFGERRNALLAGDPMFRLSNPAFPLPVPEEGTRGVSGFQTRMFPGTRLSPLPGTRTEVDSIASMLRASGWECTTLTGDEASEDAVFSASGPRILHLATHGFFAPDQIQVKDTLRKGETRSYDFHDPGNLSRSCLFFSGAQNTLFFAYDYQQGSGDGILTAGEIAEMDLDSTELVVLSACETGLGDILASEGVTGLRRAFRLAGARRVMLSLWEVDDQATQLLMREFYSNWLSGMEMDRSLVEAKKYLRERTGYTHPRYWAGFILTGI